MRKLCRRRIITIVMCIVMAACAVVYNLADACDVYAVTQEEIDKAKSDAEQIQQQLESISSQIKSLQAQANTTKESINNYDKTITSLDTQLYELENNITTIEENIEATQENLETAQQEVEEQYEMMKLRIQFMYEHNTEGYLSMILQSESIGDLLNKAEYITKISEYDKDAMEKYQETVAMVAATKQNLEEEFALLQEQKDELDTQKGQYEALQAQRQSEMNKLTSQISSSNELKNTLTTNLAELEDTVQKMEEQMKAQGNPSVVGTGKFLWPTTSTRITSNYGDTEDRSKPHQGIDIGAVKIGVAGDAIYAADSGQVTIATLNATAGNWIWIYHGDGLYTVYMHCSSLLVSVGDTVTKGQVIARMGTTGNSSGVHLHFGVRLNGSYVNPWNYVSKPS